MEIQSVHTYTPGNAFVEEVTIVIHEVRLIIDRWQLKLEYIFCNLSNKSLAKAALIKQNYEFRFVHSYIINSLHFKLNTVTPAR